MRMEAAQSSFVNFTNEIVSSIGVRSIFDLKSASSNECIDLTLSKAFNCKF